MEKRVLLAIVLSFVVLYGYQAMFPPPEFIPPPTTDTAVEQQPAEAPPASRSVRSFALLILADTLVLPLLTLAFAVPGAIAGVLQPAAADGRPGDPTRVVHRGRNGAVDTGGIGVDLERRRGDEPPVLRNEPEGAPVARGHPFNPTGHGMSPVHACR